MLYTSQTTHHRLQFRYQLVRCGLVVLYTCSKFHSDGRIENVLHATKHLEHLSMRVQQSRTTTLYEEGANKYIIP
jgi:hypothetical protein